MSDCEPWMREALKPVVADQAIEISPIYGGRNNRAYKITTIDGVYFMKHYAQDRWQHLASEYAFLAYAYSCQGSFVTKPIHCDEKQLVTIYEFINGERIQKEPIEQQHVDQALAFIKSINAHRNQDQALKLPKAAEACFSLSEHIQLVSLRIEKLKNFQPKDATDQAAMDFIQNDLYPYWLKLDRSLDNVPLKEQYKIISPSDFGFHNALKLKDNTIKFVDFEYAGWDDPAKLVCDFFNQIEVPVPLKFITSFIEELSHYSGDASLCERANKLMLFYRLKWICIVLNYFLPSAKVHKDFVNPVTEMQRKEQLDKARHMFAILLEIENSA